ncbi:putative F-box/LRR-repeat protein At3g18150 isoform X3 [Medicago truncatula]|nr:putative F-box/LRR-repeat protein At3g18150 isoform X3 [Medicago truncatula]XP_039684843.1 putative F-box/LRR-repeat protein At3g18150 isoform X3 [Medicago truncatula]
MMGTRRQRKRQPKDDSQIQDRISVLADCLLIHILSFLNTREAVQTCILSKRWINLWKTLPTLTLDCYQFSDCEIYENFLFMFLSLRDHSTALSALLLHNNHFENISLYQMVIEYAFTHNVQHFKINYTTAELFSPFFLSSHTLTSLTLTGEDLLLPGPRFDQIFPHSLSFPTLTTLSLKHLVFGCNDDGCVDPFSTFNMLTTLIIDKCVLVDNAQNLRISSTKLVNLTICVYDFLSGCNPRTADFEIYFGIELYAPTLHSFDFTGGHYIPKLFGSKTALSSIKHVNINLKQTMEDSLWENPSILFKWLVNLVNIESLTITKPALQVLSYAHDDLLKVDFPSLCNLKSLKFNQIIRPPLVTVIDFLLQNSPSAKVDFRCFQQLFKDRLFWFPRRLFGQDGEGYRSFSKYGCIITRTLLLISLLARLIYGCLMIHVTDPT